MRWTNQPFAGSLVVFCASDEAPHTQSKNRISLNFRWFRLILLTIETILNTRKPWISGVFLNKFLFRLPFDSRQWCAPKKSMFKHEDRGEWVEWEEERDVLHEKHFKCATYGSEQMRDAWTRRVIVMNVTNVRAMHVSCPPCDGRCIVPPLWK